MIATRPFDATDLEAAAAVAARCLSANERPDFAGELGHAFASLVTAEDEGQVVGFALGWRFFETLELHSIAVDPERRGRGIGRSLLRALGSIAEGHGCTRIVLEVRRGNAPALALYRALGLRIEGQRPHYYADGEDALLLEGALPMATDA